MNPPTPSTAPMPAPPLVGALRQALLESQNEVEILRGRLASSDAKLAALALEIDAKDPIGTSPAQAVAGMTPEDLIASIEAQARRDVLRRRLGRVASTSEAFVTLREEARRVEAALSEAEAEFNASLRDLDR